MKANAPERIWIDNLDEGFWFDSPSGNKSIEYIRKDAFIEKAERYIRSVAGGLDRDDDVEAFISGFRKHMKGE